MFTEDDLLPISALQHLLYCERQCALIHLERLWAENRFTAEGRHLHRRAHDGHDQIRAGIHTARSVEVRSLELGLFGVIDVVEFPHSRPSASQSFAEVHNRPDYVVPAPLVIEYKRGRPKKGPYDTVQLCAQALCLEEMLCSSSSHFLIESNLRTRLHNGAIFYGKTRRRLEVVFDEPLRRLTTQTAARLHELIRAGHTPAAQRESKCTRCSLLNLCLPNALSPRASPTRYLQTAIQRSLAVEQS